MIIGHIAGIAAVFKVFQRSYREKPNVVFGACAELLRPESNCGIPVRLAALQGTLYWPIHEKGPFIGPI